MEKEFGKWLMDIAKYVVTAIVLSSFFGEADKATVYIVGLLISGVTLYLGLQMIKGKSESERNNENTNNLNN